MSYKSISKTELRAELIYELQRMLHTIPDYLNCGICDQEFTRHKILEQEGVDIRKVLCHIYSLTDIRDWFSELLADWEYYSGNGGFPVSDDKLTSPVSAYLHTENLWVGEYGRRRRELVQLLLNYLQAEED